MAHVYFRKNSYVVREDVNVDGDDVTSETLGIDDIREANVPYSLNKKARWNLPKQLMNAIKHGDFHFEEYGVQLFEKHNINKVANCVSAYFSKGPIKQACVYKRGGNRKRRRSGYMCKQSLNVSNLNLSQRKKMYKRKRNLIDNNINVNTPKKSHVSFEVVYPSPVTSSLTHNPKYIGCDHDKVKQRSKHQKLRRQNQDIIQFDVSSLDDEISDESDTEIIDIDELVIDRRNGRVDLVDVVSQAIRNSKSKKKGSTELLQDFVIIPDWTDSYFNGAEVETNTPVRVILNYNDTDPGFLSSKYGARYVECACTPRKFIIDISDEIKSLEWLRAPWRHTLKQVHACLVFIQDIDIEINTVKDSVYKICLNTSFGIDMFCTRIETIFDFSETNTDECIRLSLFYIETLPNLVQTKNMDIACEKSSITNHFVTIDKVENSSYIPDDEFHYFTYLFSCQTPVENIESRNTEDMEVSFVETSSKCSSPYGHICAICFDDIRHEQPGTALLKCGHWFCDMCWYEHFASKVKSGSLRDIECPETSCRTLVDNGTMLSLMCLQDVIKFTKIRHDADVDRKDVTKWCPNTKCGRVLHADSVDISIAHCECGQQFCFKCLEKAHWPATCQSAKHYKQILREMGVMDDGRVNPALICVKGMACPHCKRFFEKIDGCPYMYCLCGKSFCWGCGKDWFNYKHGQKCYDMGEQIVHAGTRSRFLYTVELQNEWVDSALRHHLDQQVDKIKDLRVNSRQIAKEIAHFMNKTANHITLDFKGTTRGCTKESHKVPEFLFSIIDINCKLHFIAENTAAMLGTDSTITQRKYFKNLIQKINSNCRMIEDCFSNPAVQGDVLKLLRRLKSVRLSSIHLIDSTVRHLKLLKF